VGTAVEAISNERKSSCGNGMTEAIDADATAATAAGRQRTPAVTLQQSAVTVTARIAVSGRRQQAWDCAPPFSDKQVPRHGMSEVVHRIASAAAHARITTR
jgi:hypothetical protein